MCSTNVSPANVLPSLLLRTSPCRSPRRHPRRCSAATGIVIAIEFKLCTPFGRKLYFFAFDEYNLASNRYSVQRTPPPASDEAPYSSRPGHCLLAFQSFKRRPAHPSAIDKENGKYSSQSRAFNNGCDAGDTQYHGSNHHHPSNRTRATLI